jgi:tellurite resistance protein TehA-like permease
MPNKTNTNSDYENLLVQNLQRIVDFLKFAEAKNAALLTISSAWLLASIGLIAAEKPLPGSLYSALVIALPIFASAGLLALISFFPRVQLPKFLGGRPAGPHPKNLLYFGDIASFTIAELRASLPGRYAPKAEGHDAYIDDLTVQILVNSRITCSKLRLFAWGVVVLGSAILVLFLPLVFWAARKILGY